MDVSTYQVAVNNAKGGGGSVNIPPDLIDKIGRIEGSIFSINYNLHDNFLNYDYIDLPNTTAIKKEEGFTVKDYYQSYRKSLNYNNNFNISDFDSINIIQENGKLTSTGRVGTYISEPIDISNAKSLGIVVNKIDEYFIGGTNEVIPSLSNSNSGYLKFEDKDGGEWTVWLYFASKTATYFNLYVSRTFTDSSGIIITKSASKQITIAVPSGACIYTSTYKPAPEHYLNAEIDYDVSDNSKEVHIYVGKGTQCTYYMYKHNTTSTYSQSVVTEVYNERLTFSYSSNESDCILSFVDNKGPSNTAPNIGSYCRVSGYHYSKCSQTTLGKSIEVGDALISVYGSSQLYQRTNVSDPVLHYAVKDFLYPYNYIHCRYLNSNNNIRYVSASIALKKWHPYFDIKKIESDKFIYVGIDDTGDLELTVFQINTYDADTKTMTEVAKKSIAWNINPMIETDISSKLSELGISSNFFCDELKYDGVNKLIFHEDYIYVISAINRTDASKDRILVARYKYSFIDGIISIEFDENKDIKTFKIKDNFSYMNFARKEGDLITDNASIATSSRESNYRKSNYIIEDGYIKLFFTMVDANNLSRHCILYKAISLDLTSASEDFVIHDSLISGAVRTVYSNIIANKIKGKINLHVSYGNSTIDTVSPVNTTLDVETISSNSEFKYKFKQNDQWESFDSGVNIDNTSNSDNLYLRCDFSSSREDFHTKIESIDIDIVDEENPVITNELVTKTIPNLSRSGSFMVSSNSLANDGAINWKVTYDGGISWQDISLGENIKYNFSYVPDLRLKAIMNYDRSLNLKAPNIKDYSFIHSSILPYTDVDRILNLTNEYEELKSRVEKLELKDVVE